MTPSALVLQPEHRDAILAHARECTPEECCGVLIGTTAEHQRYDSRAVIEIVRAPNTAAGDRRRRYAIDPRTLLTAHKRTRATGHTIVGYYHSHPNGPAEPSEHDRKHAWAEERYVIVDPHERHPVLRCWRLAADDDEHWIEIPLVIDDPER